MRPRVLGLSTNFLAHTHSLYMKNSHMCIYFKKLPAKGKSGSDDANFPLQMTRG